MQKRLDKINRFIQQNLEAVRLIKANDREKFEISKFSKVAGRLRDDTIYALRLMESIMPVLLLVINGSLLIVLWMASDLLQNNTVQVGEVVAVINYKENEKFVIMGGTGSGKSTLLGLIPKMYDVREGDVYVNDINVKEWNEEDLRQTIGYVP